MNFKLTSKYLDELNDKLDDGSVVEVVEGFQELHPADVAEILDELKFDDVQSILKEYSEEERADILIELDEDVRAQILDETTGKDIAETLVDNLDSDDAADIIGELSEERQEAVLSKIEDEEHVKEIEELLAYDEDSAGGLMAKELVKVNENWTVLKCVREMRTQAEEVTRVHSIYVVDDNDKLKGRLSLKDLLITSTKTLYIFQRMVSYFLVVIKGLTFLIQLNYIQFLPKQKQAEELAKSLELGLKKLDFAIR